MRNILGSGTLPLHLGRGVGVDPWIHHTALYDTRSGKEVGCPTTLLGSHGQKGSSWQIWSTGQTLEWRRYGVSV